MGLGLPAREAAPVQQFRYHSIAITGSDKLIIALAVRRIAHGAEALRVHCDCADSMSPKPVSVPAPGCVSALHRDRQRLC